ncbi:uncharacterized protein LOC110932378 [Helianthus annuus]|uniref:uncharacterized protein LOC110932378 n=1 Tax=Helianthus annuus TaxID=4232 RepID=UPI000B8FAF84|nr:uncharacterized protein LOC110932378 [Helianthus annuus]
MWNGEDQYQVSGRRSQYVVQLNERSCTCKAWEITGIPCKHGVAAIWYKAASNGQQVGILESWVHPVYRMDTWRQVYSFKVNPINGMSMWPKSQVPTTLKPPHYHKQVGRPRKARKKSAVELEDITQGGRLSKKNTIQTCRNCKEKGHNIRSCKKARSQV